MRNDTTFIGRCDLCGQYCSSLALCDLFARYRTPEVRDLCPDCEADVRRAWFRARKVTDGLHRDLVRRAIRVLRLRRVSRLRRRMEGARDGE